MRGNLSLQNARGESSQSNKMDCKWILYKIRLQNTKQKIANTKFTYKYKSPLAMKIFYSLHFFALFHTCATQFFTHLLHARHARKNLIKIYFLNNASQRTLSAKYRLGRPIKFPAMTSPSMQYILPANGVKTM